MAYYMLYLVGGSCKYNGQPYARAGAAAVRRNKWGSEKARAEKLEDGLTPTNQRAELYAIILALESAIKRLHSLKYDCKVKVQIKSDSEYAIKCMRDWVDNWKENGWLKANGGAVRNRDLLERGIELESIIFRNKGHLVYTWIPHKENTKANSYAKAVIDE